MLFSAVSYNWISIFSGLFAAVLLIVGIAFALKLMKVAHPVPWAIAGVTLVAAAFLLFGGGSTVLALVFLLGIPLGGVCVYFMITSPAARKAGGIVTVILVGLALFLLPVRTSFLYQLQTSDPIRAGRAMQDNLLQAQAVRIRELRQQEDRQRRDLFESQDMKFAFKDVWATDSEAGGRQLETLKASPGVAWYPEVDERFDSGVQPSMSAAGHSLGRKLIPLIKHVTPPDSEPPIIQIHAMRTLQHKDARRALDELATVMRSRYPKAQVLIEQISPTTSITKLDSNAISIRLSMAVVQSRTPAPWSQSQSESISDISAELTGTKEKASVSVRVVDKPWVQNFDVFLASNRGNDLLIDGRSGRLETSQLAARNAAIEDAVTMLTPVAMEVLNAQRQEILRTPNATEVADRLKVELLGGRLIVDSFSQQLVHPMGNLWREALLVRTDFGSMERIVSDFVRQQHDTERGQLSLMAALVLLVAGIIVLHMILNWITKGYHRKSIGMLFGLLAIVGVVAVAILALNPDLGDVKQPMIEVLPLANEDVRHRSGSLTL